MNKSKKKTVYAYVHTHWDREWYREFEEFRVRLIDVFDDVLKKLETKELDTFYFDGQTGALEDYLEIKPHNEAKIKKLVEERRIFIGPYLYSTDSFLVDSESLIKNLQLGIEYSKKFGCSDFIAYHADTFGHSMYIPQIIKYFQIPNALFWRGLGELESEFRFNGLDSSYLIEGYFHDYFNSNLSTEKKAEFLKRTLDRIAAFSSENILLPLGADHLCTPDNLKNQIKEVNKILNDYEIILSSPFEYLKKVKHNCKKDINYEFRDTKRNFILPGVLSSRIDLKQNNCKLQWELSRFTQPLQAIAAYLGKTKSYQSEIDYAYKVLLQNHPHDSIYGCSVDNVHKENITRFKKVSEVSHALVNSIKTNLHCNTHLSVINLSNYELNGALKIRTDKKLDKKYRAQLIGKTRGFPMTKVYSSNQIPITEDYTDIYEYIVDLTNIKAFSSKTISENDVNNVSTLKVTQNSIENSKIRFAVINDKIEITDKISNKNYYDFISFIDRADIGDSYNFGALENDFPITSKIIKTKIKEQGYVRSILETFFEINIPIKSDSNGRSKKTKKHILKMQTILENQSNFLEFFIEWNNQSNDHLLQVRFNLEKPVTNTVSDDLAGEIRREFDTDYDIYKFLPAERGIELKHNTAPLQKYVIAQNTGIVTEGLQEYEIYRNELRLTMLRASGTISTPNNPTRGTPAGPPLPTPDLQMPGQNYSRFALTFQTNKINSVTERFYGAAILLESNLETRQFFSSQNENILLTTLKLNSNKDLVIRFLNKSDKCQFFDFKTEFTQKDIYIADSMEKPIEPYKPLNLSANSFITLIINA